MIRRPGASSAEQARAALALLELPQPEILRVADEVGLPEPQAGGQAIASESTAQIVIYGGVAGPGKTWWLLREGLRYHDKAGHRALLLRRTIAQATKPGALWDESTEMYRAFGARSRSNSHDHIFPSGSTVTIGGCEHENNRFDYDGSQLSFIGFDQVEQFSEVAFWYIALSRTRSMTGTPTRIGGTANPVNIKNKTGGWLCALLMRGGWIDAETGYALPEMSGVVRWFYRDRGEVHFFDSKRDARKAFPDKAARGVDPKSMTFVVGKLEENKKLLEVNPEYRDNLEALPWIERQRLLGGNWKVSTAGGGIVRREWLRPLKRDPASVSEGQPVDEGFYTSTVRAWDLAGTDATEGHAKDRTTSTKMGRLEASGRFVIRDSTADQLGPRAVKQRIADMMIEDGPGVTIRLPQDPGQAGKAQARDLLAYLRRVSAEHGRQPPRIVVERPTGSKLARGLPFASVAEPAQLDADGEIVQYGAVDVVQHEGVADLLDELHHYDGSDGAADDLWDSTADAYDQLIKETSGDDYRVY